MNTHYLMMGSTVLLGAVLLVAAVHEFLRLKREGKHGEVLFFTVIVALTFGLWVILLLCQNVHDH